MPVSASRLARALAMAGLVVRATCTMSFRRPILGAVVKLAVDSISGAVSKSDSVSKAGRTSRSRLGPVVVSELSVDSVNEGEVGLPAGSCATAQLPKHNAMTLQKSARSGTVRIRLVKWSGVEGDRILKVAGIRIFYRIDTTIPIDKILEYR